MIGATAFEVGNAAATLLILRATDLFDPGWSQDAATQLALVLYVLYNVAATLISIPAGRHGDRFNPFRVLAAGPGSGSAAARPPSQPQSPRWPPPASAGPHSGCWPPPRQQRTSPPARSPGSCGPPSIPARRSCS
jgi:hypothetical protein